MLARILRSIFVRSARGRHETKSPPGALLAHGSGGPLRLNLGCGDKHLPGYINVDVAPSRAGKRPDVVCDVRRLDSFATDSVDEILAVHVVEHFWRWEVVDILREWVRVLKPDGRLVLECPNLLTACEELLKDPANGAQPGPEGQRTMWVFYGDPTWRDPLMCHRWNYTPASLAAVMGEAGVINPRQEPAQFKLREPRDMRIVGEKPSSLPAGSSAGGRTTLSTAPASGDYVAFIIQGASSLFHEPSQAHDISVASTRLRVIIPADELSRSARVAFMSPETLISGEFIRTHGAPLAIVIAKVSTADLGRYQELFRNLLRWLSSQPPQTQLFADFSDDYSAMAGPLNNPFLEEYQRELARVCALTVPCAALAERLSRWTKNAIHVIEDPWERPEQNAPRFAPGATFKLCWFGNFGEPLVENVETGLVQALDRLEGRPAQLDFVTAGSHANLAVSLGRRLADRFPALTFRFIPWSLELQWEAMDECDAVLLPQDYRSDWGSVKSHNRMVETLRSGRLPIASPIPSYRELSRYAWVGEHLGDGVKWALAHPEDVLARIASGQRYLQERFSPGAIGRKWAALLGVVAREGEARHGG